MGCSPESIKARTDFARMRGRFRCSRIEQAHSLMRARIAAGYVDVDVPASNRDGKNASVVGPQVEGSAGAEIKPGVVPVAGQSVVPDCSSVKRKAHVRAPIVDSATLPS